MNMYVTYLTTKEEVFEVEIDDKDWEEFAKSEPNFPVFDVEKPLNILWTWTTLSIMLIAKKLTALDKKWSFSDNV